MLIDPAVNRMEAEIVDQFQPADVARALRGNANHVARGHIGTAVVDLAKEVDGIKKQRLMPPQLIGL